MLNRSQELLDVEPVNGSVISGVALLLAEKIEKVLYQANGTPEIMDAKQCAEFFACRSSSQWKKLATKLPRHYIEGQGYMYVRSEVVKWLLEQ